MKATKYIVLGLCALFCGGLTAEERTVLTGRVLVEGTDTPVPGAVVRIPNQHVTTITGEDGVFTLYFLNALTDEMTVSADGYPTAQQNVSVKAGTNNGVGNIFLKAPVTAATSKESATGANSQTPATAATPKESAAGEAAQTPAIAGTPTASTEKRGTMDEPMEAMGTIGTIGTMAPTEGTAAPTGAPAATSPTEKTPAEKAAEKTLAQQSGKGTMLVGKVLAEGDNSPIVGATVTLSNQNISTVTGMDGSFRLVYLDPQTEEVLVQADNYLTQVRVMDLRAGEQNDLETVRLKPDIASEMRNDIVLQLSEDELEDDEGRAQNISSTSSTSGDVFTNITSYGFSTARFRVHGYEQEYENYYINGVNFNSQERGNFNHSSLGGLNDASRNKDVALGIEANSFTYGGIGSSTNILMQASRYARGWKVGLAASNRNYKGRVVATYATGMQPNGWAFAASVAYRYSPYIDVKGIIGEGIRYNSLGYFFSAEKRLNDENTLSFVTFGAPTERGQNAAVTQEVYDLTGSIYYNPYWGYQDGKVRNSRVVKSYDPTAIISHEWKRGNHQVKSGLAFHYSLYSNSALTFYNAADPRPDYYRNLPSFLYDGQLNNSGSYITQSWNGSRWAGTSLGDYWSYNGSLLGPSVDRMAYTQLTDLWTSRNDKATQIDWNALYQANYRNNTVNPDGSAKYIIERRHNDLMEIPFNATYQGRLTDQLKLTAGVEAKYSRGHHYKTIDDLLGGNQWIDVDAFAERDLSDLATNIGLTQAQIETVKQNDTDNPDRAVKEGDKFGYDYRIHMYKVSAFAQNEWKFSRVNLYYAFKLQANGFMREGLMNNGRALYLQQVSINQLDRGLYGESLYNEWVDYYQNVYRSKGKGSWNNFVDPSFKLGVVYSINGRNRIKVNALAETRAPYARDAYVSQRIHDRVISGLASSKVLSVDATYEFNYPIVRGRLTLYHTNLFDQTEASAYYDDGYATFVNYAITGINQVNQGAEAGVALKLGTYFTLSAAAAFYDNHYTDNAYGVVSAENGMQLTERIVDGNQLEAVYEVTDSVLINGLKVASGPQLAASLKLSFFHPKMWFADVTLSYFDRNYLDFAPSHRMKRLYTGTMLDGSAVNEPTYYQANAISKDADGNVITDKYGTPVVNYPYSVLSDQESLVSTNVMDRFMLDLSVGKLFYLPQRRSLSINLSVSNLLNNTHMKTGGYQQGRLPLATKQGVTKKGFANQKTPQKVLANNVWKFPSKYYYAWGTNFFLSATYKF